MLIGIIIGITGCYAFQTFSQKIQIEDPVFSVAWTMLEIARIEQKIALKQENKTKSTDRLVDAQIENLDFLYTKVLSRFRGHPSFNAFSICYRDFLKSSGIPISSESADLFERIDEERKVGGVFYSDYVNPKRW